MRFLSIPILMITIRPHGLVLAFSEWTMPRPTPTTLGLCFRVQACGTSWSLTFLIGQCGSLDQRTLPNRPPTLQAFRSVLRVTPSVSTRKVSMALVLTPAAARFNPGERGIVYHIKCPVVNLARAKISKFSIFQKIQLMKWGPANGDCPRQLSQSKSNRDISILFRLRIRSLRSRAKGQSTWSQSPRRSKFGTVSFFKLIV